MKPSPLCLLGLVAPSLAKWQPLGKDDFKKALRENDHTLVACKSILWRLVRPMPTHKG